MINAEPVYKHHPGTGRVIFDGPEMSNVVVADCTNASKATFNLREIRVRQVFVRHVFAFVKVLVLRVAAAGESGPPTY